MEQWQIVRRIGRPRPSSGNIKVPHKAIYAMRESREEGDKQAGGGAVHREGRREGVGMGTLSHWVESHTGILPVIHPPLPPLHPFSSSPQMGLNSMQARGLLQPFYRVRQQFDVLVA